MNTFFFITSTDLEVASIVVIAPAGAAILHQTMYVSRNSFFSPRIPLTLALLFTFKTI